MSLYKLAKRVANFVWENGDYFEIRDTYDTFGELVSEILMGLGSKKRCKAILNWLTECSTEEREEKEYLIGELERRVA